MRKAVFLLAVMVAIAAPAHSAEIRPFDKAALEKVQARNAPVVIFVHATWCPICRAQEETISHLLATPRYKDLTVLRVDYDSQKSIWSRFGVTKQSTLIGFHGKRETARLSYDSDPAKVTAVLASTLR